MILLVRFDIETSNTLFEVLKKWDAYLKAEKIDIPRLLQEAESGHKEPELSSADKPSLENQLSTESDLSKAFKSQKPDTNRDLAPKGSHSRRMRGPSR